MITSVSDLDIEILYYLDIESIIHLSLITKYQYKLISNLGFIKELLSLKYPGIKSLVLVDIAASNNCLLLLEWLSNSVNSFRYTVNAIDEASRKGHIGVLEWFKKSGYKMNYTYEAIDFASHNAHIKVLDWFMQARESGLEFLYSKDAIIFASAKGNINVLQWFKDSGLEFKYDENAIKKASSRGLVSVLEWFVNSGLEVNSYYVIDNAIKYEHINVLEWLKKFDIEYVYDKAIGERI